MQPEQISTGHTRPDEWLLADKIAMGQGHLYNPSDRPSGRVTLISLAIGSAAGLDRYKPGSSILILPHIDEEAYQMVLAQIAASVGQEEEEFNETIHALPGAQDVHLVECIDGEVQPTNKVFELIAFAQDLKVSLIGIDYIEEFFPPGLQTNDIIGTTLEHLALATSAAVVGFKAHRPHVVH